MPIAVPAFAVVENVFQRHHRSGLCIGVWAEHGREHAVHCLALVSPKFAQGESGAYTGRVRPATPQVVGDLAYRMFALVSGEQTNISVRGVSDVVQHASNL
ncbi:hypothetical protein GCM10011609_72760 [Lentzea pudingi]|uniref:Uncharacterized protein n=1 Tax=Lentzea pudingi TaxID=1789439 RepID=A0ABQ2IQZ6_9PSEU|nr:hypothetical protein GCM10011609_72760 [Lentzea pudingi]